MKRLLCGGLAASAFAVLTGCAGLQSATDPAGRHATITNDLFQIFLVVTGAFFLAVIALLALAIWSSRSVASDTMMKRGLASWGILITAGLVALTLASDFADRSLAAAPGPSPPLHIRVTAQQWWWRMEYLGDRPDQHFETANELHLPAGVPVEIELVSQDVIHSLWIPSLAGKKDLIPGRTTVLDLRPTRIGLFRGQCAEFCGMEHARMALDVTVESGEDFSRWRAGQLSPATAPRTAQENAGRNYFVNGACAACHTISGTTARGAVGPDLTHIAGRRTLAGGMLPNTLGHLEGWIANPQALKPGARMPDIPISPADLHALSAYLESLT